jgi:hypothetical protein
MAAKIAKSTVFKLGSAATPTTLVDISTQLNEVKFPSEVDTPESTTFGTSGSKSYEAGLKGHSISLEGNADATTVAQLFDLLGNAVAPNFEYGPEGSTTGLRKYTGQAHLTKLDEGAKVGDLIKFSAELKVTGAVVRGTY